MTRDDMLEELQAVINDDTDYPEWAEVTLLGLLSEGQDKFCEDTGYFRDSSSFTVTLETGTALYDLPDRIIQVLSVWHGSKKLTKIDVDSGFEDSVVDWTTTTGAPSRWKLDDDTGSIIIYPTPTAAYNDVDLILKAWRYSLTDLADDGGEPELPSRFQRACIEWAAYKALSNHDAETQDPAKAAEHLRNYKAYVTDGLLAFRRTHGIETRVGTNSAYRV